jgi:protein-S-isoprenylcysteine O-methyltransferase Ste14
LRNTLTQNPAAPPFTGWERISWLASTVALAGLYSAFAVIHMRVWLETGQLAGLGVVAQETLVVVLFIVRRRATQTSHSPLAWLATAVGAFAVLGLRPGGESIGGLREVWAGLQLLAAVGYVASLGFLGRSFGIIPAHRGVRTSGPYRWVRHPVYAAYFVGDVGYLLESPTLWNLAIILLQAWGQLIRIRYEEDVLSSDPEYVAYCERVRWRLLPFVY